MQRCQNIVNHMYVQEVLGSSPSRTAYLMAPPVEVCENTNSLSTTVVWNSIFPFFSIWIRTLAVFAIR